MCRLVDKLSHTIVAVSCFNFVYTWKMCDGITESKVLIQGNMHSNRNMKGRTLVVKTLERHVLRISENRFDFTWKYNDRERISTWKGNGWKKKRNSKAYGWLTEIEIAEI